MVRLTNWPVTAVAPNAESVAADCSASTPPVEESGEENNRQRADADNVATAPESPASRWVGERDW